MPDIEQILDDHKLDEHRDAGLRYLVRYFDARIGTFEKTMTELRTDLKDQAIQHSLLLTKISEKLEQRMDVQDKRIDANEDKIAEHTTFLGAIRWVLCGMASLAALVVANTIPSFLHPAVSSTLTSVAAHLPHQ